MTSKRKQKQRPPVGKTRDDEHNDYVNEARVVATQSTEEESKATKPKYKHYSVYMDEELMDELPTLAKKWKKQTSSKKLTSTAIIRAVLNATFETMQELDGVKNEADLAEKLKQRLNQSQ